MKYIRTKDGTLGCYSKKHEHFLEDDDFIKENDIIKVADTIEELCDCIVYDCLKKPHQNAHQKHEVDCVESLKWNKKPERFENVYGAIWTDKGLIYVAKMNVKGALELL